MNSITIAIGSYNQTKIKAVEAVFKEQIILPVDAPSGVSKQPFGDKETKQGALHRAEFARNAAHSSYGIGLEGGVMLVEDNLFLCNWGVMVDAKGERYSASGARIELPQQFTDDLQAGKELSEIMHAYVGRDNIRHHEGAVGIFTNDLVDRAAMFTHVVTLLRGQLAYSRKKK